MKHLCVCVFPILWFSGAVLSEGYRGVFLLCDPLLPSPSLCLRLILHGCVCCSDSRLPGARLLGDWNSAPPPSTSSLLFPWERGPSLAGSCRASLLWCLWALSGSAGLPEGADRLWELLGRAGGARLAGVLLWPLAREPPATTGPPSPSGPAVLSASSSQWVCWLSPATSWRPNSLPRDLRVGSPTRLDFLGEPRGPTPVPFPGATVLVQICTPPWLPPLLPVSDYILHQEWEEKYFNRKSGGRSEFIITLNTWKAVLPGKSQSMGSQGVEHDWATDVSHMGCIWAALQDR